MPILTEQFSHFSRDPRKHPTSSLQPTAARTRFANVRTPHIKAEKLEHLDQAAALRAYVVLCSLPPARMQDAHWFSKWEVESVASSCSSVDERIRKNFLLLGSDIAVGQRRAGPTLLPTIGCDRLVCRGADTKPAGERSSLATKQEGKLAEGQATKRGSCY